VASGEEAGAQTRTRHGVLATEAAARVLVAAAARGRWCEDGAERWRHPGEGRWRRPGAGAGPEAARAGGGAPALDADPEAARAAPWWGDLLSAARAHVSAETPRRRGGRPAGARGEGARL